MEQVGPQGQVTTLVHFTREAVVPPGDGAPEGPPVSGWCIACMPNMREFHRTLYHPSYQRSNDVRAVTCPACKKTTTFQERLRALEGGGGKRGR